MWIETAAKFFKDDIETDIEPTEYVFHMDDVCEFNKSDDGYTTVTLRSTAQRMTIAIKYHRFLDRFKFYHNSDHFEKIVQ